MKIIKLSEKILKYFVKEYKNNGKDCFLFKEIKSNFNDFSDDFLSKAILSLQKDGFVKVFFADNVAYTINLLPDGIRNCEENTLIKKGYSALKEIKTLLR